MLKKIIRLGRFHFVFIGFLVFTSGALLAILTKDNFNLAKFIFGYSIFFFAQLSVSYSNDYFDYEADRSADPTFFSGGSKVLHESEGLKVFSKWFSISLIIISIVLSVLFVLLFKAPIVIIIIAVFANFLGWFYSAPPLRFSYRGSGEPVIIFSVAVILPVAGFITIGDIIKKEIIIILVPLLLYTAILAIVVQIPDYKADRISGKKNLVSSHGRKAGYMLAFGLSLAATVYFFTLDMMGRFKGFSYHNINFIILAIASLPILAASIFGTAVRPSGRKNIVLFTSILIGSLIFILFIFDLYLIILVFKRI